MLIKTKIISLEGQTISWRLVHSQTPLQYVLLAGKIAEKVRNSLLFCYTVIVARMSHRKWRETKQQLI